MDQRHPASGYAPDESGTAQPRGADARLGAISSMLSDVDEAPRAAAAASDAHENHLAQVRLGMASALFAALRSKHPASAAHSLRVAMGCSAWGIAMELPGEQRDEIEAAALLHDIGKIGVPDYVLLKPGRLEAEELQIMQGHRDHALRILAACCASGSLVDIVRYAPSWYNGARGEFALHGADIPLGARVLSIVDAFDSMTTDHVWRRALSRERALAELLQHAGTQFDPDLVRQYCLLQTSDQSRLLSRVASRWLKELDPEQSNSMWQLQAPVAETPAKAATSSGPLYHDMLVQNMHDGVVFIDQAQQIVEWNHGAERMTGISADAVLGKRWSPRLIEMLDDAGLLLTEPACPLLAAMRDGMQSARRCGITGRGGKEVRVNVQFLPVFAHAGKTCGAVMLMRDASSEASLEAQIQTLNERATQDALTKVSNRAEFDRNLTKFIQSHLQRSIPFALVLCDIDHFKSVNDTYGHQAGDDVLVAFAAALKRFTRPGDVVARYGGEEFAVLCADCDNATATSRAERLRREVAGTPHDALGGKCVTSSFGVTELQAGDSPETVLRRADRALYEAKEMGRNMVVQLGSGLAGEKPAPQQSWWQSWFGGGKADQLIEAPLIAMVPMKMMVEKLRGFVADQEATITSTDEGHVVLEIDGPGVPASRRSSDRSVPFIVELDFHERVDSAGGAVQTRIKVVIRPKRGRDRRKGEAVERARQILSSIKSYLMAQDYLDDDAHAARADAAGHDEVLDQARELLSPLLTDAHQA
ncbi:MAG: diguanylate cyclase [Planctomycetales bacterium]|nr:diguanylate cyclase [Planctomycetales bacterium]